MIDVSKLSGKQVMFGATVTLVDEDTEKKVKYRIVGEFEADVKESKISISSPIARALIGKTVGRLRSRCRRRAAASATRFCRSGSPSQPFFLTPHFRKSATGHLAFARQIGVTSPTRSVPVQIQHPWRDNMKPIWNRLAGLGLALALGLTIGVGSAHAEDIATNKKPLSFGSGQVIIDLNKLEWAPLELEGFAPGAEFRPVAGRHGPRRRGDRPGSAGLFDPEPQPHQR